MKQYNVIKFPKTINENERQVEAILFAAVEPLDIETIQSRINKKINVLKTLEALKQQYESRGINLVCNSGKWSFRTSLNLKGLANLQKSIQKKLSKATIETLAIIVYHQPVTRVEIEEIRGVAFGTGTLDTLLELEWVKPAGRKDVPGKPIQYATTSNFLSHFNIEKLTDLPNVEELKTAGLIDSSGMEDAIFGTGNFFKEQKKEEKKENIYSNIDDMLGQSSLKSDEDT
jgi:segregation and condensation protein B